jgi:hypothetical protein
LTPAIFNDIEIVSVYKASVASFPQAKRIGNPSLRKIPDLAYRQAGKPE